MLVPEREGEVDRLAPCVTVGKGVSVGEVLWERDAEADMEMVGGEVINPPPPPLVLLVPVRVTERVRERDFVTLLVANRVVGRGDLVMDLVAVWQRDEVTDTVWVLSAVVGPEVLDTVRVAEWQRDVVPETEGVGSRVVGKGVLETVLDTDRVIVGDLVTV